MIRHLASIAEIVEDQAGIFQDPAAAQSAANNASFMIQGQVLLLGPDGGVLAATDPDLAGQIGQQADLEGLAAALSGQTMVVVQYLSLIHI